MSLPNPPTLQSLPIFVRLQGRNVILVGEGEAAGAKRRLLDRAGAVVVGEDAQAALAIVVDDDAAVARLKARGVLVNAVDRPELCDFTLPAIIDRSPVLIAIGTGGVSAGLAAALRQRLEALLPARLGLLADALYAARVAIRARFPDGGERRRALGAAMGAGAPLDPLGEGGDVALWLAGAVGGTGRIERIVLTSDDPDDLTLRAARLLAQADRVVHAADVPLAILERARADAERLEGEVSEGLPGLTVVVSGPTKPHPVRAE